MLYVPKDLLDPKDTFRFKNWLSESSESPFPLWKIKSQNSESFLTNYISEAKDQDQARKNTFVIKVISEVFVLAKQVKSTTDKIALLSLTVQVYSLSAGYGDRLFNYVKTLNIESNNSIK